MRTFYWTKIRIDGNQNLSEKYQIQIMPETSASAYKFAYQRVSTMSVSTVFNF